MEKFKIDRGDARIKTLNRTIRIKETVYDELERLSEKSGVSLNKLINQLLEYGIKNLDESEK